ncbi:hypothetical protein ACWE42_22065 [Sutcliffiella cohnii]|uniref:ABM domain-containing protein n=1 Tax=Sutcliffiella cohnii TaxID=33932 RepID=A0A223KM01_9BACI|nr:MULTISPECIES: hypothetical protein [Sutcliffiella]AST90397.1 hypothetical protein BC6307_03480 [Sutcliffiella cohnii]MED4017487.1 hypothetical protein [Sutcliffiella cohnii]WBL16052.1 hypothetical protein O1A01_05300 [Sutcliffiella sp. NC1]
MFYARLVQFKLGKDNRMTAENIIKKYDKISRQLTGFRGSVYFFDDASGEYRALNYWDTKEHAEIANEKLFPSLVEDLQNITSSEPTYKYFEVFDPTDDIDLIKSHSIK